MWTNLAVRKSYQKRQWEGEEIRDPQKYETQPQAGGCLQWGEDVTGGLDLLGSGHKGQQQLQCICLIAASPAQVIPEKEGQSLAQLGWEGEEIPICGPWLLKSGLDGPGVPALTATRKLLWGSQLVYPGTASPALSESCSQGMCICWVDVLLLFILR